MSEEKSDFMKFNMGHVITIAVYLLTIGYLWSNHASRIGQLEDSVKEMRAESKVAIEKLIRIDEKVSYLIGQRTENKK